MNSNFSPRLGTGNKESRELCLYRKRLPCSWFTSFSLREGGLIHLLKDQFVLGGRSAGRVIFSREIDVPGGILEGLQGPYRSPIGSGESRFGYTGIKGSIIGIGVSATDGALRFRIFDREDAPNGGGASPGRRIAIATREYKVLIITGFLLFYGPQAG